LKKTVGILLLILIVALIIPAIPYAETANAQTSQSPSVFLDPAKYNATQVNEQFTVNIDISNVQNLWGWAINFTWDTNYLTLISKQEGSFLSNQSSSTQFVPLPTLTISGEDLADTYKEGQLTCDISSANANGLEDSASGSGVLANMTFQVIRQTQSTPITLGVQYLKGPVQTVGVETGVTHPQIIPASYFSTTIVSLVLPGGPTANAGIEQTVPVGTTVAFNASQSVSSGANTTYTWTFTDVTQQTLTGMIANYTFNNPGNYTVTLTVTDSLGTSNSTVLIRVTGAQETATLTVTPTPNSSSTLTPTTTAGTSPSSTPPQNSGSFTMPPDVLGILIVLTVFILAGSVVWLRKRI